MIFLPHIRITGEPGFFGQLVEDGKGHRFVQVIVDPFIIVVFHKTAAVGAGNKIIPGEGAVYDDSRNFIYKRFGRGEGE